MWRAVILLVALAGLSGALAAPVTRDDVLVVVNDNSRDSPLLGAYYAEQRGIDPANIVHVRVPAGYFISWDEFRSLRDQLIHFMQQNTLDDAALAPVVCADGEPPYYCSASTEQLRSHSRIRYVVTTRGMPTRMVVDGSALYDPAAPTSVDNYLKYWLINYFAEDTRLKFSEREVAFGDGRGMRTVLPAVDRELIIGRIDGLSLASARGLLDRTLAAERQGVYGRLFGSTLFNRWVDNRSGRLIYPPAGIIGWPYQLGLFGEDRPECLDYLNVSGLQAEGKTPPDCRVQLNEDSDPVTSAKYPAPGNAASRQPRAVDALLYQGWLDGQATIGNFDALLNWRKDAQCTVTECRDATDPAACRAASTDFFKELNSDCVGVAAGFLGYNHQSWPASYLAVWPTGWFQSTSNTQWNDGGHGDVNQLAFPEVRTDTGFGDTYSLWFRNTDQVVDPRCFPYPASDFSLPPNRPCLDQRRLVLNQRIPLAARNLDASNPPIYSIAFRYKSSGLSVPTSLNVRFFVHESSGAQIDYGSREVATLAPGNSDWVLAETRFQLDPSLHSTASYDGIKFRIETAGVYAGEIGIDAVSVRQLGAAAGTELGINGSFSEGHRQVATGDHAATFLDRLGGVAFWGSVSHHQSAGCAFCLSGMEPLVYFLRGLPLGDAVWFDASNNSGILYGDPLYSPVAVRLNPVNDTDTLSGVVDLYGSTVNGRDAGQVSTNYAIDVCPGSDFFVCDKDSAAWQSTGISGVGGAQDMLLGSWDSAGVASGSYTLRLSVTSTNTVTGRSQTLNDYYPVLIENVAPPPAAGNVQFNAGGFVVAEDGANVLVTVTRTGGSAGTITVDYASGDGTATAASDYTAVAATLSLADGVTSQSFSVPILDDELPEPSESFTLGLSNVTGGAGLGAVTTATVTINDNDPAAGEGTAPVFDADGVNGLVLSEGTSLTVGFSASDADVGDRLSFSASVSSLGTAVFTGSTLTFSATSAGSDTLTVTVTDSAGLSDSRVLPLTVNAGAASDSNGDGITDAQALASGLDPAVVDGDSDGDGALDALELGDPDRPTDSDADGIIDALEIGSAATDAATLNLVVAPWVAQQLGLDQYANAVVELAATAGAALAVEPDPGTGLPLSVEADFPTPDAEYDYPEGLFSYSVRLPAGQASVTVTVQLPPGAPLPSNAVVRKLDTSGSWRTVNDALIDRDLRRFSVTLFDNDGIFDSDPASGTIADPVGIAVLTPATPATSEGGGGGGCVLQAPGATVIDPVFPLSILLVAAGALYRRRRPGNWCE